MNKKIRQLTHTGMLLGAACFAQPAVSGTLNVLIENDSFAVTDRHYTNGLQISYLSDPLGDQSAASDQPQLRLGWQLGQSLFTPDDTRASTPLPDQRPYAGWLYAGFSLVRSTNSHIDSVTVQIGTTGPDARGEQAQNNLHAIVGSDDARGWDNQIENTRGGTLILERKWRALFEHQMSGFGVDIMPHVGLAAGNIERYANAGFSIRLGNDLRSDFGPPRIRPSLPGSAFFQPVDANGWYFFVGIDARYVDRNIFLEGDTPFASNIEREHWVGDLQAGFVFTRRTFRVSYTHVYRTEEFKQQDKPDRFGSLAFSWRF